MAVIEVAGFNAGRAGMHTIYLSAFELMLVHFRLEKTGNKDSRSAMLRKTISTHAVYDRGLKVRSLGHFMRKRSLEFDEQEVAKLEREFEVFKRARKKVGNLQGLTFLLQEEEGPLYLCKY